MSERGSIPYRTTVRQLAEDVDRLYCIVNLLCFGIMYRVVETDVDKCFDVLLTAAKAAISNFPPDYKQVALDALTDKGLPIDES